ncbi:MAG: valine--tRNA ligase [Dehalococcoidia bacterium]|nr:valine--tRNA ligase [Dehalococcoidia bacterium]
MTTTGRQDMPKAYDPRQVEGELYRLWEESGAFQPRTDGDRDPFTIIMPPPNLTGDLHQGHALVVALEDALTRWHRMLGDSTLWLPGVDHASLPVNAIILRELAKEGLNRRDIGREEFLRRTWDFVNRSRSRISEQHRRLGASADWTREAFTMDTQREKAVRTTFHNLYRDGLIYRAERLINWCVDCESAISDIEVEYEDEPGAFWHVRYAIVDEKGQPTGEDIVIATTRPETIPADTAVAVNPEDDRYRRLIGQRCIVPAGGRIVPIIGDSAVAIEAGTGALKVTPGHDPVDFEIGERHHLPIVSILNLNGTLNEGAGAYAGLDRFDARAKIVADLEADGRMVKIEPHTHAVGHCQRSRTIVEPLISLQWWVDAKTLAGPAIEAVRDGRIRFVPARFERTYLHWMENIRDWCISRQIWWGHRIPVWYCDACAHLTIAVADPDRCEGCGGSGIRQDEDTLDTWFSSGLWPHSTLGWPDDTEDLRRFYPTQVMETAYDIIFFWVARMIMLSLYNMNGVIPFQTVYLHGLVRAPDGHKMSKSRGNVVDPIQNIERYGTDGLRFALLSGTSPGHDQRINDDRLEDGRNFANKLWNASRFVISQMDDGFVARRPVPGTVTAVEDRWILSRLNALTTNVDALLRDFQLGEAARQIYDFLWGEYCDWYIEMAKVRQRAGDTTPLPVLVHALETGLRLLHPFMPFVTEAIWQNLHPFLAPTEDELLMLQSYPAPEPAWGDSPAERTMDLAMDIVRAVRNARAEHNVEAARFAETYVLAGERSEELRPLTEAMSALARARPLYLVTEASAAPTENVASAVLNEAQVILPLAGLLDVGAERGRLAKQREEAETEVSRLEAKLANPAFRERAPADVVAKEEERLAAARTRLQGVQGRLASFGH